jgi:hypothetical protein
MCTIANCNDIIKDQLKQQQIHERGWGGGIKKALPYVGRAPLESYIYL